MKQLAIIGFGALGQQLLALAQSLMEIREVVFFDDLCVQTKQPNAYPFRQYADEDWADFAFLIGLGYKHLALKRRIIQELAAAGRDLPSLVHASCFVHPSARLDKAVYLYPMCNVDQNVRLEAGVLLNNSVIVSHDNWIGACCYLSPGVTTSGFVEIGEDTFLGTGTLVTNGISIGARVVAGIGSVITKSIEDDSTVLGNPARALQRKLNLQ